MSRCSRTSLRKRSRRSSASYGFPSRRSCTSRLVLWGKTASCRAQSTCWHHHLMMMVDGRACGARWFFVPVTVCLSSFVESSAHAHARLRRAATIHSAPEEAWFDVWCCWWLHRFWFCVNQVCQVHPLDHRREHRSSWTKWRAAH